MAGNLEFALEDLECAKKIDQIRLLVVGMGGLGAVVVRDAVKSGFRSVTMMDHKSWTVEDRLSQFLIPPEYDISENRAEASLVRAQTLNHQVEVHVETFQVSEVDEKFFKNKFDVVVATCWEMEDILKLNHVCRNAGIKFFAANVFGLCGFIFADLLDKHCYRTDVRGILSPYGGKPENIVSRCKTFVPFDAVVNHSFKSLSAFEDSNPWYYVIRGFLKFGRCYGVLPSNVNTNDFFQVKDLINIEVESSFKKNDLKVLNKYIEMALMREVPVICQTVGSVLCKEIIKAVTRFEEPIDNLYIFDPAKMKGQVVRIPRNLDVRACKKPV